MAVGQKNQVASFIIVGLICAAIGFGAGWALKTKPSTALNRAGFASEFGNGSGSGGYGRFSGGGGSFGGRTRGTVASITSTGFSVQLASGSSETVDTNSSTTYTQEASATSSDVTQGATVLVSGTPNSDGSITATTVDIQPASSTSSSSATGN